MVLSVVFWSPVRDCHLQSCSQADNQQALNMSMGKKKNYYRQTGNEDELRHTPSQASLYPLLQVSSTAPL